jgi:pimeloyl-ACP methyl ester carboxylesterase
MTSSMLVHDAYGQSTGLERPGGDPALPLIVAIHGGGCTARYFDVPGFSLLERAQKQGFSAVALDRPGYSGSTPLPEGEETLANNAARLTAGIDALWSKYKDRSAGVFLVGHSMGGAIALTLAADDRDWPLLGVAVSGVMATLAPRAAAAWADMPRVGWIDRPAAVRDALGYGDEGSYAADAPGRARIANAPSACREGVDIALEWPGYYADLAAAITVPVHFRIGARDSLWLVSDLELEGFCARFAGAPVMDGRILPQVGHLIDFHHIGPAFQDEQLGFARRFA